jgi:hypothetical protein
MSEKRKTDNQHVPRPSVFNLPQHPLADLDNQAVDQQLVTGIQVSLLVTIS